MGSYKHFTWLLLASGVMVGGCERDAPKPPEKNVSAGPVTPTPVLPVAEPPLDRPALLHAVAQVASAAALGESAAEEQRRLNDKPFEFRIRFGCSGETGEPIEDSAFGMRFDTEKRTLRLRAEPDLTSASPGIAPLAGEEVETVEGFWVRWPWLLSAGCPVVPQPAEPESDAADEDEPSAPAEPTAPTQSAQRIGLATFFTKADPRTGRRDRRPYEVTKVLKADEAPSAVGYNLVLSGRLRALPQGKVINCEVRVRNLAPQCVISARFDRVWIEHPQSKAVVAEWSK